jgi:hypothetical protein
MVEEICFVSIVIIFIPLKRFDVFNEIPALGFR